MLDNTYKYDYNLIVLKLYVFYVWEEICEMKKIKPIISIITALSIIISCTAFAFAETGSNDVDHIENQFSDSGNLFDYTDNDSTDTEVNNAYGNTTPKKSINVGNVIEFGRYKQSAIKGENNEKVGFNVEPIKWRVLKIENGKALLLSSEIIDTKRYNSTSATVDGYYGNNYAHSDIREWLINDFYNTAFSSVEKNSIVATTLNNSACATDMNNSGHYSKYSSASTTDKVFLLSKDEADTYAKKYFQTTVTDYAYANGFVPGSGTSPSNHWLLRTAGNNTYQIYTVHVRWGEYTTYFNWYDDTIQILHGVRPAIYLNIDEWENEEEITEISQEAHDYIQQHINFINSNRYNNLINNADFYDTIWQYEEVDRNFTALAAWEIIGDIGEMASLNFKDLFATSNPYDLILADVLSSSVNQNNSTNVVEKFIEVTCKGTSWYKKFISLLQSSSKWDNSIKNDDLIIFAKKLFGHSNESLIKGVFFSSSKSDLKEDYPAMYNTIADLIRGVPGENWNKFFDGLNKFSTITDYINTGKDVVDCFIDAYQKYIIAQALVTTHQDILNALANAAYLMPRKAAVQLESTIKSYLEVLNYDSGITAVFNYAKGGSFFNVIDVCKGSLKNITCMGISKILGIGFESLSAFLCKYNKLVFTYNATYGVLNWVSGLGDRSKTFFLLNAAALLEESLVDLVESDAKNLLNTQSIESATRFDGVYGLLQSLEQYNYAALGEYISAIKQEQVFEANVKSTMGGFVVKYFAMKKLNKQQSDADCAIQTAVFFEGEWRNANCHYDNASGSKLVSVKCPTDVYVYDEEKNLVLSIVSNEVETRLPSIAVITDGNEKIFALPNDQDYDINVVGTDEGTMTYSVYDSNETDTVNYTEESNIELSQNCVYNGSLDVNENDLYSDYTLTLVDHTQNSDIIDIANAQIEVPFVKFTGEEKYAPLDITCEDKKLIIGEDYYLTGDYSATECGTYEFNIVGIGAYSGEVKSEFTIVSIDTVPTKDGYIFTGWFDGTGDDAQPVTPDFSSEDEYVYPHWEKIPDISLEAGDKYITYGETGVSSSGFDLIGAQIRYNRDDGKNGLRFVSRISKEIIGELDALDGVDGNVKYGHCLCTGLTENDILDDKNGTKLEATNNLYNGNMYCTFSAVVINIPEAGVNTEVFARPYIEYTDANGVVRTHLFTETEARNYNGAYHTTIARVAKYIVDNDYERLSNSYEDLQEYIKSLAAKCNDD